MVLRIAMMSIIGSWGLKQRGVWRNLLFIPAWDALAFVIWLISFTRRTIRWRDRDYFIRNGELVPADAETAERVVRRA
jgi:hypothetical protein